MVPTFANRFPCPFGAPRQALAGPQQAGKDGGRGRRYCGGMRVDISPEATAFVGAHGGRLWGWAAPPRMCRAGTVFPSSRRQCAADSGNRVEGQAPPAGGSVLGRLPVRALRLRRLGLTERSVSSERA